MPSIPFHPTIRHVALRLGVWAVAAWLLLPQHHVLSQELREFTTEPIVVSPSVIPDVVRPDNLHLVVTEDFLNSIVQREEIQPGEVREQFEDTPVAGQQVTTTCTRFDLQPSADVAAGRLVLEGNTASVTSGFSPQAVVNSVGRQQFEAVKDILFDGRTLTTRSAQVSVRAESQNIGATTMFSGRPLGPLVEHVVLSVAQQRQPAAEAFARQRVVERVYPRFNQEIDDNLGRGNTFLKETLTPRLTTAGLMPEQLRTRSTEDHLHLSGSLAAPTNGTQIGSAPDALIEKHGVSLYAHESLIQGVIDRVGLAGRKTTTRQLKQMYRNFNPEAQLPNGGLNDVDIEIAFAEQDPVMIHIGDDETVVTLRAAFGMAGQQVAMPPYEITLRFRLTADEQRWTVRAGSVTARSLDGQSDGKSVTEVAVSKLIESSLPPVSCSKSLPDGIRPAGRSAPQVTSIRSGNGWIIIGVD